MRKKLKGVLHSNQGYSLVELIICAILVVIIIAVIAVIVAVVK